MKNVSNHIALIITEVIVKAYMFIGVVWSRGNEQYKSIHSTTIVSSAKKQAATV